MPKTVARTTRLRQDSGKRPLSPGVNLERKTRSSKKAKPLQKGQTVLSNFCQIIRRSQANEPNCILGDPISSDNCITRKAECNGQDLKSMGNDDQPSVKLEVDDKVVSATSIPSDQLDSLNLTTDCNVQSQMSMVKCKVTLRRSFPHDAESAEESSITKEIFGGDSVAEISSECEVQESDGQLVVERKVVSGEAECNVQDLKSMGNDDPSGVTLEVEDKVVSATLMPSHQLDSLNVATDFNVQRQVSATAKCEVTLSRSFPHDDESAEILGDDSVAEISSECEVQQSELSGRDERPLIVEPKVVSPVSVPSDDLHDDMAQLCLSHDMPKPLKEDTGPTLPSLIQDVTMETNEDGCTKSYLGIVPTRTVAKRSILEVDESSEIMPASRKKQKVGLFSLIALVIFQHFIF